MLAQRLLSQFLETKQKFELKVTEKDLLKAIAAPLAQITQAEMFPCQLTNASPCIVANSDLCSL